MKICDKCDDAVRATEEVVIAAEDQHFDLCEKHMLELMQFLTTKEKHGLFRKKKKKAA